VASSLPICSVLLGVAVKKMALTKAVEFFIWFTLVALIPLVQKIAVISPGFCGDARCLRLAAL
jgi:hypothetical protein